MSFHLESFHMKTTWRHVILFMVILKTEQHFILSWFHQDFMISMHCDFIQGHIDKDLFYRHNHSRETWLSKQREEGAKIKSIQNNHLTCKAFSMLKYNKMPQNKAAVGRFIAVYLLYKRILRGLFLIIVLFLEPVGIFM